MPGYAGNKQQVLARLRRIEGQVRGLQRLVDEDTYCIDVLTQIILSNRNCHEYRAHQRPARDERR